MTPQKIKFTPWYSWKRRNDVKNSKGSGFYMLAKFIIVPTGNANLLDRNIIHFGETCRSLK